MILYNAKPISEINEEVSNEDLIEENKRLKEKLNEIDETVFDLVFNIIPTLTGGGGIGDK